MGTKRFFTCSTVSRLACMKAFEEKRVYTRADWMRGLLAWLNRVPEFCSELCSGAQCGHTRQSDGWHGQLSNYMDLLRTAYKARV